MEKKKTKKLIACVLGFALGIGLWCLTRTALVRAGVFDFLGAHIRHARLKQRLASHQLIIPTLEEHGFSPQAFVLLGSVHRKTKRLVIGSPAVAFVIGDGSLVLTAAHCIRAHHGPRPNHVATEQYIISPYYGDLFIPTAPCTITSPVTPCITAANTKRPWLPVKRPFHSTPTAPIDGPWAMPMPSLDVWMRPRSICTE